MFLAHRLRYLPDVLTVLRLTLAPLVAFLLIHREFRAALALVIIAGLTDWLDGFAARRLQTTSRLGVVLDPLADKVLLVTLFIALAAIRLIPVWLLSLVIARDLVIVLGAFLLRLFRDITQFLPSTLGKISTFFQIVFVLMVLLEAAFPLVVLLWLAMLALALTAFFTAISGLDYIRRGIQMARQPRRIPAA